MAFGNGMVDILLVEDNRELAELLGAFLKRAGYTVEHKENGEEALAFLERERVKMILLDIMLPGMDGFGFCADVRKRSNTPVIIISACTGKENQMNGFALGADDYVEKPVDIDVLLAKIKALMRRSYVFRQDHSQIVSGAVRVDQDSKKVYFHEEEISLTVKEYELLSLLVKNPDRTLSKEYLFNQIWGADSFSESQTLTVHIKMLRDKIEEEPGRPKRIRTVWGVGYRYEEN